jgi:3',5'-cyclic AMP phosphodiesterase CpdA
MTTAGALRLAHFSDVHVTVPKYEWHWRDLLTKRVTGLVNARLGRGRHFRQADEVLQALSSDLRQRRPDWAIFSGDASTLGFRSEMERAASLLQVGSGDLHGLAVPGNHDYYTPRAEATGHFEATFRPWQTGERIDDTCYPFAQHVGPVWLIGVNSCTGNRWPGDATGSVGDAQLERLRRLLAGLTPGPRILVTHYPVGQADSSPEHRSRWLHDLADLLRVADEGRISLWLHGHRHDPYFLVNPELAPFPIICAGSATQADLWGYNEYLLNGLHLRATRRTFSAAQGRFEGGMTFELHLRG